MSCSTINYKKKHIVLDLPTENRNSVVSGSYAIKNVNPAYYSYFHVDKENLILSTVSTSNIYLSYITYGNFDMLLKASPVIEENANDAFIHNLTCVFNYLRDNNINTDEQGLGNYNLDMSWIIVTVLLIASFKVPDCLIKNGKKFYDYVKSYVDGKKEYLAMVESKVDTPVSAINVIVEPLCQEVVDILKKP
jgi:hypothetical protein